MDQHVTETLVRVVGSLNGHPGASRYELLGTVCSAVPTASATLRVYAPYMLFLRNWEMECRARRRYDIFV